MATIALSVLRSRLRVMLEDEGSKLWKTDAPIDLALNEAVIKFTHDIPTPASKVYTIASDQQGSDDNLYLLPTDMAVDYFIRGYFETSASLENIFRSNQVPGTWELNAEPRVYYVGWPSDTYLYLPREPSGTTFTFYYGAYHDTWLDSDTDTVDLGRQRWGELAILYYAGSLALLRAASARAHIEQWNTKADQNVGNPLAEESNRWREWYNDLLREHTDDPAVWEFSRVE